MTTSHALIAFLIASNLLTITPGLDTALVLRTAGISGGKRAAAASAGICLGLLIWGFTASVGLGALLNASRIAYNVLRISGACYLIFLGLKIFLRSLAGAGANGSTDSVTSGNEGENAGRWFARGLLTNLLNPKVGVFYVTFLPLFIPAGASVVGFSMLLTGIHVVEGVLWFAMLIAAVRPLSSWLRSTRTTKALDRVTGAVFVGFGFKLLFDRSR